MGNDKRFPYQDLAGVPRAELDKVITGIAPMIREQVSRVRGFAAFIKDEIYATCLERVWERHLKAYDTTRGAKLSTYLHRCCQNDILEEIRRIARSSRSKKTMQNLHEAQIYDAPDNEESLLDERIQSIASSILKHPERYFTPQMIAVLKARHENPGISINQLAEKLGYERPNSLSMILGRMRQIIADINIEDHATPATRQPRPRNASQKPVLTEECNPAEGLQPGRVGEVGGEGTKTRPAA